VKLAFVHVCGFRGYKTAVRVEFSESFTIIDGRNGVGKSTIFDAVEFALTGTITKYLDAKSGRESVADYLWWIGDADALSDRFVEVGFRDGDKLITIRRTPLDAGEIDTAALSAHLVDPHFAPKLALPQLCMTTIIRDEHIARLSLDLKEGDRFALLRDAIGAVDAEDWIRRAQALASTASAKVKSTAVEAEQASQNLANAVRQIDQARAALPPASLISQAASRLQTSLRTSASPDQLADIARRRTAEIATQIEALNPLVVAFDDVERLRVALPSLDALAEQADQAVSQATTRLDEATSAAATAPVSTALSEQARRLEALVNLGREVGLRDSHCPLCESAVDHSHFEEGLEVALTVARQLDAQAVEQARMERARDAARAALTAAEESRETALRQREAANGQIRSFDERLKVHLKEGASRADIERQMSALQAERQAILADLQLIDTISLDRSIARATTDQETARERIARAETRLGRARLAETRAKALYDAARRAAAETLDQRLERVLPLMSELYKRLRPHPVWSDIEYSVRGDVQRFLKLQVGGDVNPQFVFSSGQRRATGLAFLLSVNLSLTWSRWRSILLDDPVQHVDDFRTVHLAEVLAHLCQSGRQIICAVEDSALADLLCRRLPTSEQAPGKRIMLGADNAGALAVVEEQQIAPLSRRALVLPEQSLSA
jgi:recombinational DNA repair ATPase RecF